MSSVASTGDVGDLVYALAILSELPNGPHTLLVHNGSNPRNFLALYPLLKDLVFAQPYIKDFRPLAPADKPDWHSEDFRNGFHQLDRTLIDSTWAHGRIVLRSNQRITGHAQWLHGITPDPHTAGRVVIARSPRYQNDSFPWPEILRFYNNIITFVGLPQEHADFEAQFDVRIPYRPVASFLEMASVISGSELFIGNQSAPGAIAEGLKHPRIQETCLFVPDCIYQGGSVQHVADGTVVLPGLGDKDHHISPSFLRPENIPLEQTLPGGWSYDCGAFGTATGRTLEATAADAARRLGVAKAVIRQELATRAIATHRKFFTAASRDLGAFEKVICALRNSGIANHPLLG